MHADGTHVRRVTSSGPDGLPDGRPQFSPDGRSIVFQREGTDSSHLMIVRTNGTGLHSLLPNLDGSDPSWSARGDRIAFTLTRRSESATSGDVATVRPDGTGLAILTDSSTGGLGQLVTINGIDPRRFRPQVAPRLRD